MNRYDPFIPLYEDDSDYTTNAPSYYDDLARKNKLIKLLSLRIWKYDKELAKRFEEWDKNLEEFPEEIKKLLLKWLEDGTLFDIIDEGYGGMRKDFEQSFYYDELTYETHNFTGGGNYSVIKIPTHDKKGNKILIEKGYSNDKWCEPPNGEPETARKYATRNHTSLTINASTFNTTTYAPLGIHIKNGVVQKNTTTGNGWTLTYNSETQELNAYPPNVDGETLVNTYGVTDAWSAFYPLIQDHVSTPESMWKETGNTIVKHPRQVIAQLDDKSILIFTFRGREDDHQGFTYPELQQVLQSWDVKFAYNMDGGGSVSTVKDNVLMSVPVDRNFGDERPLMDFLSVKKPTTKSYESFYKTVGELSMELRKISARYFSKYGDDVPGRIRFRDFMYLEIGKAIYGLGIDDDNPNRILGQYKDGNNERIYLGNINTPMSFQSSNNIQVSLGNDSGSYRVSLVKNVDWTNINIANGLNHMSNRPLQYKSFNAFETRIRGGIVIGNNVADNMLIGSIPENVAPSQTMVIPVSVISGGREGNDVIINADGAINLRFGIDPINTNENTSIQIETVINRGV